MTERQHELLNRFLDGELTEAEQLEFEVELGNDPSLLQMRDDFSAIGNMIRTHVDAEAASVSFDGFIDGIDSKLADFEPAPTAARAHVESVRPPVSVAEVDTASQGGLLDWLKANLVPVTLGAMAAAAILLVMLRPTASTQDTTNPVETVVQEDSSPGEIIVDSVVNEGGKAVLVSMPTEDEESTVIWLLDEEEKAGEPENGEDPI
ncbi:MAG: anti-sigma factor family protein [Bradymonadia bacterium]